MSTSTLIKLGYSDPRTDVFGAHPLLGAALDLNDGVTFTVVSPDGLELSAPEKTLVPTGNVRTQGERITRAIYRRNRTAVLRIIFGPAANYAAFAASVRSLVRWLDAPPAVPVTLQWQPPSATSPVYLDVVGAAHGIPADEREWLRLQVEPIEIVFVVRPGLRGDRVTLSNLVVNPGFEQGSGPAVTVFNDSFATTNAYSVQAGGALSVASNVMTLPSGGRVAFGSPAWESYNLWQLRWQWVTGLTATFYLHYTDGNNNLYVQYYAPGPTLYLVQTVGGTNHILASANVTLTTGAWYWLQITQFPTVASDPAAVQATLSSDSGGSIGASVASLGPVGTYDTVTALSGRPQLLATGAALAIGGAFAGVHTLSLFGPGSWSFLGLNGTATGLSSGAWEQNTANTYSGGAVTSYRAGRVDLAPAGTVDATLSTPSGTGGMPVGAGQTVGYSGWVRTSGLAATTNLDVSLREYDANGTPLRITRVARLTGNQAAWTQQSATLTTGASCASVQLVLEVGDNTAGVSANGTVWWDNQQVWNVTTTGQTSMPYCELRFAQSPAQLVVTGLLGDLPAPAHLAWGTYLASWAIGATLTYALGRRAQATPNARLALPSVGFYGAALSPTATPVRDATAYAGYYPSALVSPGWNPRAFSFPASDLPGVYHLFTRFWTAQTVGNLANVSVRAAADQKRGAWYGDLTGADVLGSYYGPYAAPLSASSTWTVVDAGQFNVPMLPVGALTDLTASYLSPRSQWVDATGGGSTCRSDWQLLLPVDGSLLLGVVNNPSNSLFAITTSWLWAYHDGLLVNRAGIGDAPAATYSVETGPTSNPAQGGGGPGTATTGVININSGADPYLTLDPTISCGTVAGVNQLAGYVADNAGAVLPLHVELQYSPLYLYPR